MISYSSWISLAAGLAIFLAMAMMAIVSRREGEGRAAWRSWFAAGLLPIPFLLVALLDFQGAPVLRLALASLPVIALLLWALPLGRPPRDDAEPIERLDERDVMFSRNALVEGSERFEEYYRLRPENRAADDRFRTRPGLLSPAARLSHGMGFAAAEAAFAAVEALHPLVEGEPSRRFTGPDDPAAATAFLKTWARRLGAHDVGVTALRDIHKYTHVGRGERWGEPVDLDHDNAIALTVEMDKRMVDSAPRSTIVMESARKYMDAGSIAVQLAMLIRSLGFPARAHIDANYRVMCPLVARDAGLGSIGRMGLLMTPDLGPRVRIAVVTTDLPLVHDARRPDPAMIDFCTICRKCADVCPSQAIPFGDREVTGGALRWQIDSEACFEFWCRAGTDCGRCIRACPYSHPDNLLHGLVRSGLRRSGWFRRAALKLDDLFYGRRPVVEPLPDWMVTSSEGKRPR